MKNSEAWVLVMAVVTALVLLPFASTSSFSEVFQSHEDDMLGIATNGKLKDDNYSPYYGNKRNMGNLNLEDYPPVDPPPFDPPPVDPPPIGTNGKVKDDNYSPDYGKKRNMGNLNLEDYGIFDPPPHSGNGKLKVDNYGSKMSMDNLNLEDYHSADPPPTSKVTIKSGPIEHGTPLIPYIPKPTPPGHPKQGGSP